MESSVSVCQVHQNVSLASRLSRSALPEFASLESAFRIVPLSPYWWQCEAKLIRKDLDSKGLCFRPQAERDQRESVLLDHQFPNLASGHTTFPALHGMCSVHPIHPPHVWELHRIKAFWKKPCMQPQPSQPIGSTGPRSGLAPLKQMQPVVVMSIGRSDEAFPVVHSSQGE